jgi:hypothetical protein
MIHGYNDETKEKVQMLAMEDAAAIQDVERLQREVMNKANANHNHDSRYYTKSQVDTKIDAKTIDITGAASSIVKNNVSANKVLVSNSNGKVAASSIAASLLNYLSGLTGSIQTQLNGKAPSNHSHDDRYYTESETNNLLNGKANANHNHDDRYYTESETNNLLNSKANTNHNHDDRYAMGNYSSGNFVLTSGSARIVITTTRGFYFQQWNGSTWVTTWSTTL